MSEYRHEPAGVLPAKGFIVASIAAGPVFVASFAAALLYAQVPHAIPVEIGFADLGVVAFMAPIVVVAGFLLSLIPNLVGAAAMTAISGRHPLGRAPLLWVLAGGAIGGLLAWLMQIPDGPTAFALVATSALCARICRWR